MKLSSPLPFLLLSLSLTFTVSVAWEVDRRCLGRLLEGESHSLRDENDVGIDPDPTDFMDKVSITTDPNNRELQSSFQLKMYWQEGYCWQEEWIERRWCMSCQGRSCGSGERLWLQACNAADSTQKFKYVPVNGSGGGQLMTASTNLCLERISDTSFKLNSCLSTKTSQIYLGINTNGSPFEINPKNSAKKCLVNNDHHPKASEIIYSIDCKLARFIDTSQWTVYNGGTTSTSTPTSTRTTLRLRNPDCNTQRPCVVCEGHCSNDDECRGTLTCFQRKGNEQVLGCSGTGTAGKGYCI